MKGILLSLLCVMFLASCAGSSKRFAIPLGKTHADFEQAKVDCGWYQLQGGGWMFGPAAIVLPVAIIAEVAQKNAENKAVECMEAMGFIEIKQSGETNVVSKSIPNASKITLVLSDDWEKKPPTEAMITRGVTFYALNRTIDAGVLVAVAQRKDIKDLMSFAASIRANQASALSEPQSSEIMRLEINGRLAFRSDVTGYLKSGNKMRYLITIIEGTTEIAILNAWATPVNFDLRRGTLEGLAEKIVGF